MAGLGGEQTTTQSMWGPQQHNVETAMGALGSAYGAGQLGYHGVGYDPALLQRLQSGVGVGLDAMGQYGLGQMGVGNIDLAGATGAANQMLGGLGQGMRGLGATAGGGFVGANPFLAGAIGAAIDPMLRAYQDQVVPSIDFVFGSAGRGGSGMHMQARTNAARDLAESIGNVGSTMSNTNYQAERDRMMQAQMGLTGLAGQGIGNLMGLQRTNLATQGQGLGALQGLFGMQQQNLGNALLGEDMRRQHAIGQATSQRQAIENMLGLSGTMGMYGGATSQMYNPGLFDFLQMGLGTTGMILGGKEDRRRV